MATSKHLLITLCLLLLPAHLWAQPTLVGSVVVGETASSTTVSTTALTVGSLTNGYLMCGVATDGFVTVPTVTGVQFAGQAMTFEDAELFRSSGDISARIEFWSLTAPPAATSPITASYDIAARSAIGCLLWSSVNQATPHGTLVKAGNRNANVQVIVGSSATEIVVDLASVFMGSGTATPGSGQTQRVQQLSSAPSNAPALLMSTEAGATSVTMSWHMDDSGTRSWATIGVPLIHDASGGGASPKRSLMTTGVGDQP